MFRTATEDRGSSRVRDGSRARRSSSIAILPTWIRVRLVSEYYERALSAEWHRQMLVHQLPRLAALLPDARVADRHVDALAVLHLRREVHRNGRPRDVTVARHLKLLARSQRRGRGVVQQILVDAEFVFLPALVGERREVVEDQAIVLCIEFRGIRGVPGTPRGAIVLNQLAKRRRVAGFLLSTRSGKGQHPSEQGQQHINRPVVTRTSLATMSQRIREHEHLALELSALP